MNQKIHTGCSCNRCKSGKDKKTRRFFHRMLRHLHKRQLKRDGDIKDVNKSIKYTD